MKGALQSKTLRLYLHLLSFSNSGLFEFNSAQFKCECCVEMIPGPLENGGQGLASTLVQSGAICIRCGSLPCSTSHAEEHDWFNWSGYVLRFTFLMLGKGL